MTLEIILGIESLKGHEESRRVSPKSFVDVARRRAALCPFPFPDADGVERLLDQLGKPVWLYDDIVQLLL